MNWTTFSLLLLLLVAMVLSLPTMQRIVINNHEWEVPNEPGWEEVLKAVELVQRRLSTCLTVPDCRRVTEDIRAVFNRYPVSKKYFETNEDAANNILGSIFKWG